MNILFALVICFAVGQTPGDCPNGVCPSQPQSYRWQSINDMEFGLYLGNRQVGYWSRTTKKYNPLLPGGRWGPDEPFPVGVPKPPEATVENYGLDLDELSKSQSGCRINGKCRSLQECITALNDADFPNDNEKLRVTAIGDKEYRTNVKAEIVKAGLLEKVHFQGFAPGDTLINCGFETGVTLQNADGGVVHHQPVEEGVQTVVTAIRKVRPDRDPKADPDVNKPESPVVNPMNYLTAVYEMIPPLGWVCLIVGGVFLYARKGKVKSK
jgi:hypothetical protein